MTSKKKNVIKLEFDLTNFIKTNILMLIFGKCLNFISSIYQLISSETSYQKSNKQFCKKINTT